MGYKAHQKIKAMQADFKWATVDIAPLVDEFAALLRKCGEYEEALLDIECDSRGIAEGYVCDLGLIKSRSGDIYNRAKTVLSNNKQPEGKDANKDN